MPTLNIKEGIGRWVTVIAVISSIFFLNNLFASELKPEGNHATISHADRPIQRLADANKWKLSKVIKTNFQTCHAQGLVKIGELFYLSAVEVFEAPQKLGESDYLWDFTITRSPGEGQGWLFKFDLSGQLISQIKIGEGDAYHPGGMGYDGKFLWIPVAEYRPNSFSTIIRVDPETMNAKHSFDVKDHIGNMIYNPAQGAFFATSWGSRRIYRLTVVLDEHGKGQIREATWVPNPSYYVDYQDCQYVETNNMLCSGVSYFNTPMGRVAAGGIDLLDISGPNPAAIHQLPVPLYLDDRQAASVQNWRPANPELIITNNAFWMETVANTAQAGSKSSQAHLYFMTEGDNQADLLVYEADIFAFREAEHP